MQHDDKKIELSPVEGKTSNWRLDQFITSALEHSAEVEGFPPLSRQRVQSLVAEGHVSLKNENGLLTPIIKKTYKVKQGDVFLVTLPKPTKMVLAPEDIPLDIFYEDDDLIVINKTADMASHPAPGSLTGTLVHALLHHCKGSLSGIGGVERPGIVHRLDKGTSGLMVVAKNDAAHTHLSAQFKNRTITRRYVAFCYGALKTKAGIIEGNIGRNPKNRKKMAVVKTNGKTAKTEYTVERIYNNEVSKVFLKLHTGRTHQIRVHMAHQGYALLGDPLYGRVRTVFKNHSNVLTYIKGLKHQALHAYQLGFEHPTTKEELFFESPLPKTLELLQQKLTRVTI